MATTKFQREPKMMTTEPSVDESGVNMKKGGKTKKMAMGGNPMMSPRRAMAMAPALLRRKKGGEIESPEEHKAEMREMNKVEKELKHHESMKAGKAHHGLKNGGKAAMAKDNTPGGLLGGLSATRPDRKKTSGGIELTGYKKGGMLAAKGDAFQARSAMKPKIDVQDKVNEAKQVKGFNTKTSAKIAGPGYKKGGTISQNVANRYLNDMHDGEKMPTKKPGTGEIKQRPAGYKKGGHVKGKDTGGHVAYNSTYGHSGLDHSSMYDQVAPYRNGFDSTKKMKKGGKCNY